MSHSRESDGLGTCPRCRASIPAGNLLIRYETEGGEAAFAACPGCEQPVHPA